MRVTAIRVQATRLFSEQLVGTMQPLAQSINDFCDAWIAKNNLEENQKILPYFLAGLAELKAKFKEIRDDELLARFALRAIKSCVDPT